jgi:hypothetical protein
MAIREFRVALRHSERHCNRAAFVRLELVTLLGGCGADFEANQTAHTCHPRSSQEAGVLTVEGTSGLAPRVGPELVRN